MTCSIAIEAGQYHQLAIANITKPLRACSSPQTSPAGVCWQYVLFTVQEEHSTLCFPHHVAI